MYKWSCRHGIPFCKVSLFQKHPFQEKRPNFKNVRHERTDGHTDTALYIYRYITYGSPQMKDQIGDIGEITDTLAILRSKKLLKICLQHSMSLFLINRFLMGVQVVMRSPLTKVKIFILQTRCRKTCYSVQKKNDK